MWIALVGLFIAVCAVVVQAVQTHQNFKLSLFEKRFAVFQTVETFILSIFRDSGDFGDDYQQLLKADEQAEFLFPLNSEVVRYMKEIRQSAKELHAISADRDRNNNEAKIPEKLKYFGEALRRRIEVFQPYLSIREYPFQR